MTKTGEKKASVMENVWMTRKTLEIARKNLKSKVSYKRQSTDEEIKTKSNKFLVVVFGCFIVLIALALAFGSITWASETFKIDEVPIVTAIVCVILLFVLLFS